MDRYSPESIARSTAAFEIELGYVNSDMDALRGLAYRAGIKPLYTEMDNAFIDPDRTRDELLEDITQSLARLETLSLLAARNYIGEENRRRAELLIRDVHYQCNELNKPQDCLGGKKFIEDWEMPEARVKAMKHQPLVDIVEGYLLKLAQPVVSTEGAQLGGAAQVKGRSA